MKKSFIHQQEEISFVKNTFTQYLIDKLDVVEVLQTSGMSLFAEENAGITKEAVLSESEVPAASAESVNQEAASDPGNTDVSVTEAPAEAVEGAETQEELIQNCPLYQRMWQAHVGARHWAVGSQKEGEDSCLAL